METLNKPTQAICRRFLPSASTARCYRWFQTTPPFLALPFSRTFLASSSWFFIQCFLSFLLVSCAFSSEIATVDKYGQCRNETWQGKIISDEQLQQEAEKESTILANISHPNLPKYDRYGGRMEDSTYSATGFFHIEKVNGRWWFITPEGHRFFLIGCDSVDWNEFGYSTPLFQDGQIRPELPDIPEKNAFPEAYQRKGRVNFLTANLKRKYGSDFALHIDQTTRLRLAAWGFNSSGKWGWGKTIGIPYFEDTDIIGATKIKGNSSIDIYDPEFPSKAEATARTICARRSGDPMLIAYACENENGWSRDTIGCILKQKSNCFSKKAFFQFLAAKCGGDMMKVAELAGKQGADLATLLDTPFDVGQFPPTDVKAFIVDSSKLYHSTLRAAYKKYDPNHLFMAASNCCKQEEEWIEGELPYVDFIGAHEYSYEMKWFTRYFPLLQKYDKPFAILEFSFVCEGRGYSAYNVYNTVGTEQERGICYRNFTENVATDPYNLGFGYFIYWDQPVTKRTIDGENCNFGLVSQQDTPYYGMLEEVVKTNERLFDVHDGKTKAFKQANITTYLADSKIKDTFSNFFISESIPKYVSGDFTKPEWFDGCTSRLKIDELSIEGKGTYYFGTTDLRTKNAHAVEVHAFVWNGIKDVAKFFQMEASRDNVNFSAIPIKLHKNHPGSNYAEYSITNDVLPEGASYIRIGVNADRTNSWACQLRECKMY